MVCGCASYSIALNYNYNDRTASLYLLKNPNDSTCSYIHMVIFNGLQSINHYQAKAIVIIGSEILWNNQVIAWKRSKRNLNVVHNPTWIF